MTAEAADWSEHDLDHRFNAGEPHDELTQLAATFDRMLARLAASLRREQRFSAELSHELRTPLAAIVAEAELALRRERTAPMTTARPSRRSPIAQSAGAHPGDADRPPAPSRSSDVARGRRSVAERDRVLRRACRGDGGSTSRWTSPGSRFAWARSRRRGTRSAPVLENACRYARSRASVEVSATNGTVEFTVTDDGPGVARPSAIGCSSRASGEAPPRCKRRGPRPLARARLAVALEVEVDNLESDSGARFRIRIPLG